MATQTAAATPWTHTKGAGATYDITIPAATAGSTVVLYIAGGAVPSAINLTSTSGPTFTRRTPAYSSGTQDTSIWDATAVGGETTVHVVLSGDDNLAGIVYQFAVGLTFVAGANNGAGASSAQATDFQIRPSSAVTVTDPSLLVAGFSVDTTAAFSTENSWRSLGPAGHVYGSGGNQPGNGGANLVWQSGLMDVNASHAYPEQNAAGTYEPTSVWLGAGNCYATAAVYADSSGVATNPAVPDTVKENSLPGTHRSNWYLSTGTNATICGYTDKTTYAPGQTVEFFVDSTSHAFRVEVYRLGYYGDENFSARNVLGCQGGYITGTVVTQSAPTVDSTLGSTSCAWTTNASWTIPSDAVSGQYYALLRRTDDTTQVCCLDFIVSASPAGRIAVCLPDMTRHAYNVWGATGDHGPRGTGGTWSGRSLYQAGADAGSPNMAHRAYAVDVRRPNGIVDSQTSTYLTDAEQGTITFLEAQGYNLAYLSNWDLDANPSVLQNAGMVVMLGHHEYWTTGVYDAFQNAVTVGVNVMIQSSNTALWHVRFAASDTNRNTMICYKDSATADESPGFDGGPGYDPVSYTGTWRDTRMIGGGVNNTDVRSEDALTGQLFVASGPIQTTLSVPASAKGLPIWRNSAAIQALTGSSSYTTIVNALGYEADYPSGGPHQPTNLVNLNPYSASFSDGANANGSVYSTAVGPITCGCTLYRANSGALVFNTGVWRGWWGVSRWQGGSFTSTVDANWQNALLALLYDLGAAPIAAREMQPGIDTALTNPATGAPAGGRSAVARAYGLRAPSPGFLSFFV